MFKKIVLVSFLLLVAGVSGAANVPKYLNYQGVLFDDGGNPLPDGTTQVAVRILDAELNVLYEEQQDVEVISGVVSIMVGDGLDPATGVSTGGISAGILVPDGPKYLEVQAEGYPPEGLMELVSVPYARYAGSVAEDSVGPDQIKEGAIRPEHLAEETLTKIAKADSIGVTPDFSYSSSETLGGVLKDFDHAIKKRSEDAKMVDSHNLSLDGSDAMTGSLNMSGNRISGLFAPSQPGDAATKQYTDDHINSSSNPHAVTPSQIGAVSAADLFDGEGKINVHYVPTTLDISDDEVGHGRVHQISGMWQIDDAETNNECVLLKAEPLSLDWRVKCIVKKTDVTCGQVNFCQGNGENDKRITKDKSISLGPAWAPDGTKITYASYLRGFPDIYTLDLKSGHKRQLTNNRATNITPSWSPIGSWIAYSSSLPGNMEIYAITPDGTNNRRLTKSFGIDISPNFSPDGNEFVYASERGGHVHIYKQSLLTGKPKRLTYVGSHNDSPDWSPDGQKVTFCGRHGGVFDIFTVNIDGSNVQRLTISAGNNEHPRWSPDGRFIVYSSTRFGKSRIFMMRYDGAHHVQLNRKGDGMIPDWGPWED